MKVYSQAFNAVSANKNAGAVANSAFTKAIQSLLFTEISSLPELIDDNLDVVIEKRPRGRPRKQQPDQDKDDKRTHKIEWDDSCTKTLNQSTIRAMITDFKNHYIINQIPLHHSIDRIVKSYNISYKQAHAILEKEF